MANGRLASKKVPKKTAQKVYTNTSVFPASVSIHATAHSETVDTKLSLAVDTNANHTLNFTTQIYGLGFNAASNTVGLDNRTSGQSDAMAHNIGDIGWSSIQGPRISYSIGGALVADREGGSSIYNYLRLDPYYLTNPEEYGGKTKPSYMTNDSSNNVKLWKDVTSGGSLGIGSVVQRVYGSNHSSADYNASWPYYNRGMVFDPYKTEYYNSCMIGWNNDSYMAIMTENAAGTTLNHQSSRSSDAVLYQVSNNGRDPSSYTHPWYQGVMWFEKGVYVCNASSVDRSKFGMGHAIRADGSFNENCIYNSYGTGNRSYWFNGSGQYPVCWMKYNPNNDKYYLALKNDGILEFDLATLNQGSTGRSITDFTSVAKMPHEQMSTPMRIAKALWHSVDADNVAWVSADFITWTKATTHFDGLGLGANVAAADLTTNQKVNIGESNVHVSSTGFSSVADDAILEYRTSLNSYERNGLLLNSGDTLYAENTGAIDLSVSVMGYEDE